MTDREPADQTVNARLTRTELRDLDEVSDFENRTRSSMVRILVREGVERRRQQRASPSA